MLVLKTKKENEESPATEGARRATGVAGEAAGRNGDRPDLEVSDKATRRRFSAQELRQWLGNLGTGTLYIEPGSPWEKGYCESFNGTLRDECLNGEIFYSLKEAQIVIEGWRVQYNTVRPHSALDYRPPAPGACNPFPPPN